MANEFVEARLELGINYGASYGPRFNTAISVQADGHEYRRPLWDQPLLYASVGDRLVTEAELDYLIAFHAQTMGSYRGFRLKDWSDYKCTGIVWGNGAGAYQVLKVYGFGGVNVLRPLTRLVAGTVQLFSNGVAATGGQYSVNLDTGVITTGLGGTLTVTCEFDVPVRFEQDKIDFTYEGNNMSGAKVFSLAPLNCTELRQLPAIAPDLSAVPYHLAATVDLGHDYGTLGGPAFSTRTASTASEFEDRKFFWVNPKHSYDIGDRRCNRADIDHLLALFRVCRGRGSSFVYYDHQTDIERPVRFAEDRISFRFDAYRESDGEALFNLGGIALMEIFDGF